ncbi:hypothetical protein HP548_31245 [Paenibacillus taichungensis]|uniref:Uncharacterized protein n=1 Tax=Paenibacillus taichungensis TaxID=484184 RepID=A0ABX2MWX6_9BACL|nr:hypothetical protein [Paenibacillus taichungensis]NUU58560.1 hypothetical protein [Paenibacillus taichungensis]
MLHKLWAKVKKGMVLSTLICLMLMSFSGVVSANSDEMTSSGIQPLQSSSIDEQINKIYEKRGLVLAQKKEGYLEEYDRLGKELESLGVEFLSPSQVEEKMEIAKKSYNGFSPQVIIPANGKYTWSSIRNSWVKNGVTYEVQHLTAESNSNASILKGTQAKVIQSSINLQAASVNLVTSLIKEGATELGKPIDVTITIYDALKSFVNDANFGRTTIIPDITTNYTVSWYQNIDFMYVKKQGDSDNNQELTFMSSAVAGETTWVIPTFNYKVSGATKSVKNVVGSNTYNYYNTVAHRNGSMGVAAYLNPSAARNAYVTYAAIIGVGGKNIGLIPVATPASPVVMP